jgi:hypothetical protein
MSKMIRKTFVAVLLIALFTCSAITAQAHEAVDMTRDDCTLTIEMKYAGKPVAGGTLTLYRVGDVVESNGDFGFRWKDGLNCTVDMDHLESMETAAKVLECVKLANLEGITVRVDENGKADFDNLEIGLYLIEQKQRQKDIRNEPVFGFSSEMGRRLLCLFCNRYGESGNPCDTTG